MTAALDPVLRVLSKVWGDDSFRPLQEDSIRAVLERHDSLTVLPTGGGFDSRRNCRVTLSRGPDRSTA